MRKWIFSWIELPLELGISKVYDNINFIFSIITILTFIQILIMIGIKTGA